MCDKNQQAIAEKQQQQQQQQQQAETKNKTTSTGYPFSLLALDNEESNIVKGYN